MRLDISPPILPQMPFADTAPIMKFPGTVVPMNMEFLLPPDFASPQDLVVLEKVFKGAMRAVQNFPPEDMGSTLFTSQSLAVRRPNIEITVLVTLPNMVSQRLADMDPEPNTLHDEMLIDDLGVKHLYIVIYFDRLLKRRPVNFSGERLNYFILSLVDAVMAYTVYGAAQYVLENPEMANTDDIYSPELQLVSTQRLISHLESATKSLMSFSSDQGLVNELKRMLDEAHEQLSKLQGR